MRMLHYFSALVLLVVPALLWTAWTGIQGSPGHVNAGLFGAVFCVAAHSLLIVFMIVTGRVLREAVSARSLDQEYLQELNEFFARKSAYPAALLAVLFVVIAAVLGYGNRGFELPPAVHMLAGLVAVVANMLTIPVEVRALRENQRLLDRAAEALDRIDRESAVAGDDVDERNDEYPATDARAVARFGLVCAIGAWMPYLYWALIVWKGAFDKVSLHPWLEISVFGLLVWLLARRERASSSPAS